MAKRFIDTEIFDDPWYMDLSVEGKLFWIYCITKCDHAGILELNKRLAEFQIGIENLDTVTKELGNRLLRVSEHLFFIPKFLEFQYPEFPNSKVKTQISAVNILTKYGLFKEGKLTVSKVLPNTYGNGNGNGIGNVLNVDTNLITIGGNFDFDILMKNDVWMQTTYTNAKISENVEVSYDRYRELTNVFISEQRMNGTPKSERDYRNHFTNWIKIQFRKPENQIKRKMMP